MERERPLVFRMAPVGRWSFPFLLVDAWACMVLVRDHRCRAVGQLLHEHLQRPLMAVDDPVDVHGGEDYLPVPKRTQASHSKTIILPLGNILYEIDI